MTIDSDSRETGPHSPDLWRIPEILSLEAVRVQYSKPRIRAIGPKLTEAREAVEILVRTSEEFPVRALSPALYVGDVAITDSEEVEENLYRFFAYDFDRLEPGAPIEVGWMGFPDLAVRTKFQYEVRR